ncbi:MAG: tagatose 1,6-diphosphate aldolase [Anaerolineales bacterium]
MNGLRKLTIGKRRGLVSTSTAEGLFTILAFDHRQSFEKMLGATPAIPIPYSEIAGAKLDVISQLADQASAILLDPLYGAAQAIANDVLPAQTGLLVAVEETGYSGEPSARTSSLLPDWGVEKIKRMGADAVKLLIYYHPDAGPVAEGQELLVKEIAQACRLHDIALFLEVVSYSINPSIEKASEAFAKIKPELITRTAAKLSNLDVDVLKLEFPVDAQHDKNEDNWYAACEAITKVAECPWTLLSAGVDFSTFANQVRIACMAGASGYIAGRTVWKEGISMDPANRKKWLKLVAIKRLNELQQIALELGRPWQVHYPRDTAHLYENWYREY